MAMRFSGQWYMDKNNRGGVESSEPGQTTNADDLMPIKFTT